MAWGKDDNNPGPWGRPSGGRSSGGNGGDGKSGGGKGGGGGWGGGPQGPEQPDFEEWLRKGRQSLQRAFSGAGGSGGKGGGDNARLIYFAAGGALLLIVLYCFVYFVKADEQGVVLRFGAYHRTTPPGIGFRLPYPIETVVKPKVTTVNRVEIGMRSNAGGSQKNRVPQESLMLTGDENIVDITFEVQWKIRDAGDFLFNVRNPEETVKAVAESAMREVIGSTPIANALAEGKLQLAQATRRLIQETLDSYDAGVEIVSVNLGDVDPPEQVIDAFRDVQSARADMETARNQAEAYRNDILPRARGEAQKMVLDAEGYKQEVIARARGDASRFAAVYAEYRQSRDVTRKRLYLETMEEILPGMQKMIVDKNGAGVVPYLPLPGLKPAGGKTEEQR